MSLKGDLETTRQPAVNIQSDIKSKRGESNGTEQLLYGGPLVLFPHGLDNGLDSLQAAALLCFKCAPRSVTFGLVIWQENAMVVKPSLRDVNETL